MSEEAQKTVSQVAKNFGITIAFLLPGFIALWALQYLSPTVAAWLSGSGIVPEAPSWQPSTGSFLLVVIASLALGMLVSAIRWVIFDRWLYSGRTADLDWSELPDHLAAFDYINENHYRYYQYYANSAVAVLFWCVVYAFFVPDASDNWIQAGIVAVTVLPVLVCAAWDAREKNTEKLEALMRRLEADGSAADESTPPRPEMETANRSDPNSESRPDFGENQR